MRNFLIKSAIFLTLCGLLDFGLGKIFGYLTVHATGGYTKRDNFISDEVDANILIFGSSRAAHHYVPSILSDSLDMSCYNCGLDGNGIIYGYGKLKTITARYYPKIVILDIQPTFDLFTNDNCKYLAPLRPYYQYPGVDSLFWDINPSERWKMMSNSYRFNSKFLSILMDNLSDRAISSDNGYMPLYDTMTYEPSKSTAKKNETDPVKIRYFEQFICEVKRHSALFVFISPEYGSNADWPDIVEDICAKYSIPYYNYLSDKRFANNKTYFADSSHLNDNGARAYTEIVAADIKMQIENSPSYLRSFL